MIDTEHVFQENIDVGMFHFNIWQQHVDEQTPSFLEGLVPFSLIAAQLRVAKKNISNAAIMKCNGVRSCLIKIVNVIGRKLNPDFFQIPRRYQIDIETG